MIGSGVFTPFCLATICALVCLFCLASCTSGEYVGREPPSSVANDRTSGNEFGPCTDGKCVKRTPQDITGGMWFGPRLGRRRRSEGRKSETDPEFDALANILDGSRWAVITIPGGEKRQPTQFTPRLGRDSGEDLFSYGFPKDQDELYAEEQLFPPLFAPRLGRRLPWTPSPRLGRQLYSIFNKPRQYADDSRF
ncbi:pheromone biosynthesis-activating neuropeptide [Nomia melanderi]|uniref:pheromone biosynthesis-activating neuropeptide n=1 Tax=Nomia melanderi TaxID=2448451 RepID=UPI00130416D7|nr:PBAN-type neuropeptides-like [Nomia melanderi]